MVTGAGGSIGSELCRQLAEYSPSKLIMLDRYENGLFDIGMELKGYNGASAHNICAVVGDIQDVSYLDYIFSSHTPQIVFHAAAYKHVPLMETHPVEAVKNNIFGTMRLIESAAAHGAERFVMISTDKAVNPTSVMGATKRVAELLTYRMNDVSSMCCNTVRFGNVLGTNGSVLPIFKEQIKRGGPVTVTHPDMKRFFMLVAEAVQLVLIAAAQGRGGEIYVLDMGEPVRIIDLAENLIRLAGFMPYKEIGIEFTGLRPGEKLYEDLYDKTEKVLDSAHAKLKIVVPEAPPSMVFMRHLSALEQYVKTHSGDKIIEEIQRIVPNFRTAVVVEH
jgi:FlaA1/EpsC-like NDP-sugar epimerase